MLNQAKRGGQLLDSSGGEVCVAVEADEIKNAPAGCGWPLSERRQAEAAEPVRGAILSLVVLLCQQANVSTPAIGSWVAR